MAIDITGIINENEFYSHHYLSAIFESDIKEVFKKWSDTEKETSKRPPYAHLRSLSRDYFKFRQKLERTKQEQERRDLLAGHTSALLEALGYEYSPVPKQLDNDETVTVSAEVQKNNGAPELWVFEVLNEYGDTPADPLSLSLSPLTAPQSPLDLLITKEVFGMKEPPRWVLVVSDCMVVLIDRSKWNEKRMLRFDLTEIFARREDSTFKATAALLHRDGIAPADGISLLDTLDEKSHKHVFSVSEDLKYSLRESIELLGNEAIHYLKFVRKEKGYEDALEATKLTIECIRFMYRLLFIFYIEARPELEYAPMKSDAYRMGYSLETLRDLEMVKMDTDESKEGYFFHESIHLLFRLIFEGTNEMFKNKILLDKPEKIHKAFKMPHLKTHIFSPSKTLILNKVKFRNEVLQQVIRSMSLSRPRSKKERRRGRISYAQLGINQLGAVYEALLSYQGFFAPTDLYEVKKAGESYDELNSAYFVKAEDLKNYSEEERVYLTNGSLKMFPKGTFIYRLSGRSREKSASYYTPEVLTRSLVKYALKELLKDLPEEGGADAILKLTVCEPAMGSAAFLNEAVNQLAEVYLERKQRETGRQISHDEYGRELQRVKMLLVDNNVFGVDLNFVAVELAQVSLFLNSIHKGYFVPWFGMQLTTGNSLIGARRQVFDESLLMSINKKAPSWWDAAPVRVKPGEPRPEGSVYHFLLPAGGMADYKDKVVKKLAKKELQTIQTWSKEFARPLDAFEMAKLQHLSNIIDQLWKAHSNLQAEMRKQTTDPLPVWGQEEYEAGDSNDKWTEMWWKEKVYRQEMLSEKLRNSSPYRRLKMAMDYWCALWFWPIEKAKLLPSRDQYYFQLGLILEGGVFEVETPAGEQKALFADTMKNEVAEDLKNKFGVVDVDGLCEKFEQLRIVTQLVDKYKFLHWELEFADIFASRGGFDLILGNPPWLKVEWNEGGVMGDYEPLFVLRKFSASKLAELREKTLDKYNIKSQYLSEFEEADGTQNFLNAFQNFPILKGTQSNLYKCFLPQAWLIGRKNGISGFLHPEGVYDDPKGGKLREAIYPRLKYHFQFVNEHNLFSEVDHHTKFSINVYKKSFEEELKFYHIANLFIPQTIDTCYEHSGSGAVPGIKDEDGKWNINGHRARILNVGIEELTLFAKLYDVEGTAPLHARLAALHAMELIEILKKFSSHPKKLGDLKDEYFSTEMWHETNAQKDGTIRRETRFPKSKNEWILSGPHFFVGNPFNKTPRAECKKNSDYDNLMLSTIPDDYLPRTNYVPACSQEEYQKRTPRVPWGDSKLVTEFYRFVSRRQLSQSGERTLISVIMPPGASHVNPVISTTFKSKKTLIAFSATCSSLVLDFYVKSTGKGDLYESTLKLLPIIEVNKYFILRFICLISISKYYAPLWDDNWDDCFTIDRWTKDDPRLTNEFFKKLKKEWHSDCALRTDYVRRQALVEIDVLAAMALGLTFEELKTIYRIQFPVLQAYEKETFYDKKGQIVFSTNRGFTNVGVSRAEWNEIKSRTSGIFEKTVVDDTLPGDSRERVITYHAPFDNCNRETDYEIAWKEFEKRLNQ